MVAALSLLAVLGTLAHGWSLGDAASADWEVQRQVSLHFISGLATLIFVTLVHALVLTYFMGTGRWLEDVAEAYGLEKRFHAENQSLKYRTIPAILLCFLVLVFAGASGALADPASGIDWPLWWPLSAERTHLTAVLSMLAVHTLVCIAEYRAIVVNGRLIEEVMAQVRTIRAERGLPVS